MAEVDAALASASVGASARERFSLLGERRLLAVHYPRNLGGRGLSLADHSAIAEHLGAVGLPDEVHLVTVQGVGCTILAYGDEGQRERWLPGIAGGRAFASLLLSEEQAGSDITGLATTAAAIGDGYVLNGHKTWNLRADWSNFGLCSARTRLGRGYDGISLFIVDFAAPGVDLEVVARGTGEPYFTVHLDDVRVGTQDRVGAEHGAWNLLVHAIGFERAGFDYLSRARRWLRAAKRVVDSRPPAERRELLPDLIRQERAVANARALAYRAVGSADGFEMDEVAAAYSKLACGEAAQSVARWAALELVGAMSDPALVTETAILRQARAEAPELSISGGAEELQLDLIATEQRISGGAPVRPLLTNAQKSLVNVVRASLSATSGADAEATWRVANSFGAVELALPKRVGGVGLSPLDWCLVAEEFGARLCDPGLVWRMLSYIERHCARGTDEEQKAWAKNVRSTAAGVNVADVDDVRCHVATATTAQQSTAFERVRHAAYTVGISRRALELARDRAALRRVGGTVLIERQAVAHRIARTAIAVQRARLETYEAAWTLQRDEAETYLADTALAESGAAAIVAVHEAVQIFGAAGTSHPDVVAVYGAAYRAATAYGSPARLWRLAAERRYEIEPQRG